VLVITPNCVLSFPALFTPKPRSEGGEPVFSCSLIFDMAAQQTPEYKAMQAAVVTTAHQKWGGATKMEKLVLPFKDAGEKSDKYAGYDEGFTYVNVWSQKKPGIVDARLQDVLSPDEVYAGQVVKVQLAPFPWENTGRRGISFGLQNVQVVKKNAPRIDGRVAANKAFEAVVDETEEVSPF